MVARTVDRYLTRLIGFGEIAGAWIVFWLMLGRLAHLAFGLLLAGWRLV